MRKYSQASEKDAKAILPYLHRESLAAFTESVFAELETVQYLHNWHIQYLCEHLEAVLRGEILRLIINEPPRSMKSLVTSVAFPAWGLGKNPGLKFLCGSYSDDLSTDLSVKTRDVMQARWYREAFPNTILRPDQNEKTRFDTTKHGYRIGASVGGGRSTGFGGDIVNIDDPLNPKKADSKAYREEANKWVTRTMRNRLNNKKTGAIILTMHRLHPVDPAGMLLDEGGWHHICLPAENTGAPRTFYFKRPYVDENGRENKAKIWKPGEILHPERFPREYLDEERKDSYNYAGQFLQVPVPEGGGMVKLAWFGRYVIAPAFDEIVFSLDTASKAKQINDPSVCQVWGINKTGYYLLHVWRERYEYPDLKHSIYGLANKWNPHAILIEDKSSGQALIQDFQRESKLPVIAIEPHDDKITRMRAQSGQIEAGKVFLPQMAQWLSDYETEITNFPKVENDDQVDATSQFLKWARERNQGISGLRIRSL